MKATLSLAPDGRVLVEFPACDAWAEHSVLLPPTASAMKHIVSMLSYQEHVPNGGKLAREGAPTQAIVDAWLREEKRKVDEQSLNFAKDIDI